MQQYELLVILPGTVAEDEAATIKDQLSEVVTAQGATELSVEDRGKSRLAYPMKHIRYGYFYFFRFTAESAQIPVIQEKIRLTGKTLRALLSKFDSAKEEKKQEVLAKLSDEKPLVRKEEVEEEEITVKETPVETPVVEEVKPKTPAKKPTTKQSVSMEEIDEKLNEILDGSL